MQCEQVKDYLSAYIDSELEASVSIEVAKHTEQCVGCREELRQLKEISRLLRKGVTETQTDTLARAGRINTAVLKQIQSELAVESLIESRQRPRNSYQKWGFKLLSLAATLLMAIGAGVVAVLIYQGDFSGPLLAGASRNHRLCNVMEKIGLGGWSRGEDVAGLTDRYGVEPPVLGSLGLNLEAAHPCRVNSSRFLHMVYSNANERVSVYYGSDNCVDKLRSQVGSVELGKVYSYSEDSVQVSAFTVNEKCLWMVAGRVTPERLQQITTSVQQGTTEARAALR